MTVLVLEELVANKIAKFSHFGEFVFQLKVTIVKKKVCFFKIINCYNGYEKNKEYCDKGR